MNLNEIRDTLDRRQSQVLFEALRSEHDDEQRFEIANVLGWVNDPRLVRPLGDVLTNRHETEGLRRAASEALQAMTNSPEPDHSDIEMLWNSGDLVLQRHALAFLTWRHETMFSEVLDDPEHPLYLPLLSELRFAFPFPRFAETLVKALSDPRADVRYQAAQSLIWNEPAIAVDPLIDALDDPDIEVQAQIIETLQYYPFHKVRSALRKLVGHEILGANARTSLAYNDTLFSEKSSDNTEMSEMSVSAEASINNLTDDNATGRPGWLRSAGAFQQRFGNLDTCWALLILELDALDWNHVSQSAREEIADFMYGCTDVLVRQHASSALVCWGDERAKLLLGDRYFAVAKSAGYEIRNSKASQDLLDQVWTTMKSASGVNATELLESFIALSDPKGWQFGCATIAMDQYWEENTRNCAINALFDDFEENGIGGEKLSEIATAVLNGAPVSSWMLHCTVIERITGKHEIAVPDLTHLKGTDHRPLEKAIAGINQK